MTEYVVTYTYNGNKTRTMSERSFPTLEKAKNEVKKLLSGRYYSDFVIAELLPVISVKMPEPSWTEIQKEIAEKPVTKVASK